MNKPKLIRDYIYAAVLAKSGLPASNVLRSPRYAVPTESLPALAIYGQSDKLVSGGDPQDRIYTVAVDVTCLGRVEDDATDVLSQLVRSAITEDDSLGGLAVRTVWSSQIWGGVEQTRAISGTLLTFDVYYRSQEYS
jgi:hypothetical protein